MVSLCAGSVRLLLISGLYARGGSMLGLSGRQIVGVSVVALAVSLFVVPMLSARNGGN